MGQSKARNPSGHLAAAMMMIALALAGCSEAGEQAATPKPENTVASRFRAPDVRYQPSPHQVVRAMLELAQGAPHHAREPVRLTVRPGSRVRHIYSAACHHTRL